MELIDKDFIKKLGGKCIAERDEETKELLPIIGIDLLPTVDAEPVRHARLVNAHPYGECSCCGELIDSRDRFRYCPHCGARLVGEGEKDDSD